MPAASALALIIACLDLLGWALGSTTLVRILPLPGAGIMMPNTALGLLGGCIALWLLHDREARPPRRRAGQALALGVMLLGLLTFAESLFHIDLGIDLLFFPETVQRLVPETPGRPSPVSSVGFALLGLALLLLHVETRRGWRPARFLALIVAFLSTRALIGYAYLEESLLGPERLVSALPPFTPIALHTALLFLALSIGVLFVSPERGLTAVLLREDAGGILARRLLPAAILIPLLVGAARPLGERLGLYRTTFGASIIVLSTIAALLALILRNARAVSRWELSRKNLEQAAAEQLRESEERFRTAFEHAPTGMTLVSLDGRFLNVNDSLCRIVGYTQEELLARSFQDITHPEDLEEDLANVHRLLDGTLGAYQMEKRYFHKDGHIVTILLTASLVHDSRGKPLYFISQIQDISERKQLEQAWRFLAETGPRLAGSLDVQTTVATVARLSVPALADWCMIALIDDEGRIQSFEGVAGSPEKQETMRELVSDYPPDPTRPDSYFSRALRTRKSVLLPEVTDAAIVAAAVDARHLELLRLLQPLSAIVTPLIARDHIVGMLTLATAESGRRYTAGEFALVEELAGRVAVAFENATLYRKSEQATRTRDEVLRIVAHDLRTPLHVISMSARLLMKRLPEESIASRQHLDAIGRAVDQATRLIQDLLDVARLEAGRLRVERRPEDTVRLVKEVVALHHELAEARSIQLTVTVQEDCPHVFADRNRVNQILSNLLGNALKFTPAGGQIAFRVEPAEGMLRFSVSDTGPGIPVEEQPHLFEPFWQGRGGSRDGAGLGLAIVRGLVEAHEGRIWVESSPGSGSTFFFTLPTVHSTDGQLTQHA